MASRLLVGVLLLFLVSVDGARPAAQDRTPQLERVACDYPVPMPIPQDVNRECGCPDGARTIAFAGTVQGDTLTFTRTVESGSGGRGGLFGQAGPEKLVALRVQ